MAPVAAETSAAEGVARIPLTGAGAVAFDPSARTLAWASGASLRMRDLASGDERSLAIASEVTDLGFAPDGALWVVAGQPALWRDGKAVCRVQDFDADRLLAVDAEGAVVTSYTHSDGVGMVRHQFWVDAACRVTQSRTDPMPASVDNADADPGAPLVRASLAPPRQLPGSMSRKGGLVAASSDGKWQVVETPAGRVLQATQPD